MGIQRNQYLKKLISFMWDGQIKVITGIGGCGKSYLLHHIFYEYLLENKVKEENILSFQLDLAKDVFYRNPLELAKSIRNIVDGKKEEYYLFIDEIQMADEVDNPYSLNSH